MSVTYLRNCSLAALTIFSAQGAWADVSAQDVWADWKAYLESSGYTVDATEAQSGDTLEISDFTTAIEIPEEDMTVKVVLPNMTLVDTGEGTVTANFPAASKIRFSTEGGPETFEGEVSLRTDGSPMLVTGDPDDLTYTYNTDLLELTFGSLSISGEDIPAEVFEASLTLLGMTSKTHVKVGEARSYDQSYDISKLTYDLAFKDPEDSGAYGKMKGDLSDLKFAGISVLPADFAKFAATDLNKMLDSGFAFDGVFSFGSGQSAFSGQDASEAFELNSASQGGTFEVAMNKDALEYDLLQKGSEISLIAPDIPFPIAFSAAEIGMKILTPPTATEEDGDMGLGLSIRDFSVPENLWAFVDPTGVLPHDPASVVLDLSAKGRLLYDIFDPEAAEKGAQNGEAPGIVNSAIVNQLLLRAAGAELTGTGSFEFDHNDLESYDGMPAPIGVANLSLIGANGLIDNLIKMGIVSDSDATGARLMMGLLAVPGEGEDSLKSEIEFDTGGQISANGQRIK